MIKHLPCLALIALSLHGRSQSVEWLNSAATNWSMNPDMPVHLIDASDNGDHVFAARLASGGWAFGTEVFGQYVIEGVDPLTGTALPGCYLTDSVLVRSLVVADNGIAYLAGRFMGNMDMCGGGSLAHTGSGFDEDLFLMACEVSTGLVFWSRNLSMAYPTAIDVPVLALDASGALWYGLTEFDLSTVVMVDALGTDVLARTIEGARELSGLDFDPWNNLFASGSTGNTSGPLVFGGLTVPVSTTYAMFALRMDPAGQGSWARIATDFTFSSPNIACDPNGNAFVAGALGDSTTFAGVYFNGPNWVYNTFLLKLDSTGTAAWGIQSAPTGGVINGDFARANSTCIATDGAGNVYLFGDQRGQTDWGNGVVGDAITMGASALSVVAFNGAGLAQWDVTSMPFSSTSHAVGCDQSGIIYFSANIMGMFTLGPHTTNSGGAQAFCDGRINSGTTGMPSIHHTADLLAWPSPSEHGFFLNATPNERVRAWDASGALLFDGVAGSMMIGADWSPGLYTIAVGTRIARVVKE